MRRYGGPARKQYNGPCMLANILGVVLIGKLGVNLLAEVVGNAALRQSVNCHVARHERSIGVFLQDGFKVTSAPARAWPEVAVNQSPAAT